MKILMGCAVLALLFAGCSGSECKLDETYQPAIDPADFVATVDNPLYPLTPGTRYTFEGGGEVDVVEVTRETKVILGVTCIVVRDTVSEGGQVTEATDDWYVQDKDGNVWYFGEDSKEYKNGKVTSTGGSWEAGVDGAQPGIIMEAQPQVGDTYRQEYYACEAEDMGEVLALSESVSVPYGDFEHCLETRDFSPLEPGHDEHKYYCPGVGVVLEVGVHSGNRNELVSVETF